MEADRDRCLAAGMDNYLSKPIKPGELQQMLQQLASPPPPVNDTTAIPAPEARPQAAFDYAAAMAEVDQEIIEIIARPFVDRWPEDLVKLQESLARGDIKSILHTSHALKGTLSMFGARPASELAHQIEQSADVADADRIATLLEPFAAEVAQLIPLILAHSPE
jgi:HPt (histidine-containing phosphotransfer) domain-containing protein